MSRAAAKETIRRVQTQSLTSKQSANAPTNVDFSKRATFNILITPELASWILENRNGANLRKQVIRSHVEFLTSVINAGDWFDNHPMPIVFDENGDFIDGQHRLLAVITSGKSVWMKVEAGYDEKVSKTLDSGKPRALKDHVSFSDDPTANKYISIVVKQYHNLTISQTRLQPLSAYEETYLEHAEGINFAAAFAATKHKGVTRAGIACALVEMYEHSQSLAIVFANSLKVVDGAIQPARMLRDWCLRNMVGGQGSSIQRTWYDKAVFCMNAAIEGRDVPRVQAGTWTCKKK